MTVVRTALSIFVAITTAVQAADVLFKNQCGFAVQVYDGRSMCEVRGGSFHAPTFGCGRAIPFGSTMYRHGVDSQATLAEFARSGGKAWYDLSIIPPGSGNCNSWQSCKSKGTKGFNVAMMILPTKNLDKPGSRCSKIMCQYDGCPEAFLFPSDPQKTYNCPDDELFHVIFCP